MKYKLVIFDFDGTLADSMPWSAGIVNQLAHKHKFKAIQPGDYDHLRGLDARAIMKYLRVPRWKTPIIAKDLWKRMAKDIDQIPLFAGIAETLALLSAHGVQLALISSNADANVRRVLGPHNAALFSQYACGVSLFGKSPRIKKVLRQSRIRPSETIMIGDEIRDAQAAQRVGIAFGAVAWGYTHLRALQAHSPQEEFLRVQDIAAKLVT